jgi:predicted HicB family RNase H-like nuclease
VTDIARIHYEIPDDLHRRAKAAAAMRGQTLKDFLIEALEQASRTEPAKRPK